MEARQTSESLGAIREQLLAHPMYGRIDTAERTRIFMQHHVFAVWDFMSLLKRLQNDLTCVEVPWIPRPQPLYTRFINDIVLGEECDEDGAGGFISHFDLYVAAMVESGADVRPIQRFVADIRNGSPALEALDRAELPPSVHNFVRTTLDIAQNAGTHEVSAAFFYGREDIIPGMFSELLREGRAGDPSAQRLNYYLERHIMLDGDQHGPLAQQILDHLCGGDAVRERQAASAATRAIQARIALWDGVVEEIARQ